MKSINLLDTKISRIYNSEYFQRIMMTVKILKPLLGILVTKAAILGGWYLWKKFEEEEKKQAEEAKQKFRFQEGNKVKDEVKVEPKAETPKAEVKPMEQPVKKVVADKVLSVQEAADLVNLSKETVAKKVRAGDIPIHETVNRQHKLLKSEVVKWHKKYLKDQKKT